VSVAQDIWATYYAPGTVFERLFRRGPGEDRALAYLMGACLVLFIAQMPRLAREAHLSGEDLNALMGGALMGLIFVAPLLFYGLAWLSFLLAKLMGGQGTGWHARTALFWALLASGPLVLLHGLVAGFIGPGLEQTLVGAVWFGAFMWFWGFGLWRGQRGSAAPV